MVSERHYIEKIRGEVTAACVHVLPAFLVLIQMLFLVDSAYLKKCIKSRKQDWLSVSLKKLPSSPEGKMFNLNRVVSHLFVLPWE